MDWGLRLHVSIVVLRCQTYVRHMYQFSTGLGPLPPCLYRGTGVVDIRTNFTWIWGVTLMFSHLHTQCFIYWAISLASSSTNPISCLLLSSKLQKHNRLRQHTYHYPWGHELRSAHSSLASESLISNKQEVSTENSWERFCLQAPCSVATGLKHRS